jgi:ABC-type transport system involved in cytochrome c biogenesis permease subunit
METLFFSIAFTAYTVGMALYLGYGFTKRERLAQIGRWLLIGAVLFHIASLIVRTYVARQIPQHGWYVPWSNWFESFSFFTVVIIAQYLIIQRTTRLPIIGAFVVPLAWASIVVAINSPFGRQISSLPLAL